jgi:large repetitive protein
VPGPAILLRFAAALGLALGLTLVAPGLDAAAAISYTVNATGDGADAKPGDGHCRTTAGACTIRAAVMESNATSDHDAVIVPAGTYALSIGGMAAGDAGGDLNITGPLTIQGAGSGSTTVVAVFPRPDSSWAPNDPAVRVEEDGALTMTGLTITSDWPSDHAGNGGGVVSSGILTLRDVALKGNFGSGLQVAAGSARLSNVTSTGNDLDNTTDGLGIYVAAGATLVMTGGSIHHNGNLGGGSALFTAGTTTLTNVDITDNLSEHDFPGIVNLGTLTLVGGQVARNGVVTDDGAGASGGIQNHGQATITGTKILDNSSLCGDGCDDFGGGVGNDGTLTMTDVLVKGNFGYHNGGGIDNRTGGVMTLRRVSIVGNRGRFGGGIANHGTAKLTDVVVARNHSKMDGGGLFNDGRLTGNRVSIYRNQATKPGHPTYKRGGGIANHGALTLTNATVVRNHAGYSGGAIYNNVADGGVAVRLTNVTIAANTTTSPKGTTLQTMTAPTLSNTVIAAKGRACTRPVSSLGGNLATDATCRLHAAGDQVEANPKLAWKLAKSGGGYTPMLALLAGSPAIDHGFGPGCPAVDQRVIHRPVDGDLDGRKDCDAGAFEYKP